ncbi:MAG: tyrosine-type recombinase/integrase [archaeon]
MDSNIVPYKYNRNLQVVEGETVYHLTPEELDRLTLAFDNYYYEDINVPSKRKVRAGQRGRYRMVFLFMRWTGARISEILSIDEKRDLDLRNAEVTLPTLKRHSRKKKRMKRVVPIPEKLVSEYLMFVNTHPNLAGKVFKVNRSNFFRVFKLLAKKAGISEEIAHPHVLRHTRAIELLRSGVPVTIVQSLLGHASLSTTAIYLRYSATETKQILKDRGVI